MIKFRKQNALAPEQDSEIILNLTPFMFFALGYVTVKVLISTLRDIAE